MQTFLCRFRVCVCVFLSLCVEYVCTPHMLLLISEGLKQAQFEKLDKIYFSAPASLGTFHYVQILGSHFNNLAFFITCNVASALCVKKETFQATPLNYLAVQMSTILQESPFPVFFADLI